MAGKVCQWQEMGQNYVGTIPAFPNNTLVSYYISATDNDNGISTNPHAAPSLIHTYLVGYTPPPLYISEFMASNATILPDPDDSTQFPDWIELHNAGNSPLNLGGYFLSDERNNPTKFEINAGIYHSGQWVCCFFTRMKIQMPAFNI